MPYFAPAGRAARSIRSHLLLLVLGVLLPALGFSGFVMWRFAVAEQARLEGRAVELARETSASIDRAFVDLISEARVLASSDALGRGDLEEFHGQMLAAQESIGAVNITLRDAASRQVLNSNVPWGGPLPATSRLAAADARAERTGQPVFTGLYHGVTATGPQFAVVLPLPRSKTARFLSIAKPIEVVQRILEREVVPVPGMTVAVVDRAGLIVASSSNAVGTVGREVTSRPESAAGRSSVVRALDAAGEPDLDVWYVSAVTGWWGRVSVPEGVLYAPQREALRALGLTGAAALGIALAAALLVGRRMTAAVTALAGAAAALGGGEPVPVLATRLAEANAVGAAMASAAREREAAEAGRRGSESLLRLFVDRAPAAIAMFDTGMHYLAASRRYAQDFYPGRDLAPDAMVGRSHHNLFPDVPDPWRAVHRRVLGGETIAVKEDAFPHPDGRLDWVRWEMTPWYRPDGAIGGTLLFSELITARKQAEAVLARDRSELERLVQARTQDLQQTQARLAQAEKLAALGQLAGGIAHDFNNVLQAVHGGAGLIADMAENPERVRHYARMIADAVSRGAAVTRRLLAFSRRGDLRAEPLHAATLLGEMREVLAHTLGPGIAVDVKAARGLPLLLADKGQIETVLVNLAANARDAMPEGGTITMSARLDVVSGGDDGTAAPAPGVYVQLGVADAGTGMTPEVLARAAEPFFTTKPPGQGTGLGLAMARGFAEQSGGGFAIESAPGRGTEVRLWFPLAPEGRADPLAPQPRFAGARERHTVLIVDDEPLVREITAEQLSVAGYDAVWMAGGTDALALLDSGEAVDVLVTDLSMPGMDGLALIREAQRRRPGLPAILLTGFATDAAELAVGGAMSRSFTLLRKPVDHAMLLERIARLTERAGAVAHEARG